MPSESKHVGSQTDMQITIIQCIRNIRENHNLRWKTVQKKILSEGSDT